MPKKREKAALEKAQRKLARAQLALQAAQTKRAQAITKGERDVEQARQRAARREAKATTRVEKRASDLARAEGAVLALAPRPLHERAPAQVLAGSAPMTPEDVALRLEQEEQESARSSPIIVPDRQDVGTGEQDGSTTPNGLAW